MADEIFREDPEGERGWELIRAMQMALINADEKDPGNRHKDIIVECPSPEGITESDLNSEYFEKIPGMELTYRLVNV